MDCSPLIRALNHIPLANEGKEHAELRRTMARAILGDNEGTKQHLASFVHAVVAKSCRNGASVDLVRDVVRPIADALFATFLGMDIPAAPGESDVTISQIFDRALSLNRRKEIGRQCEHLLDTFSASADRLKVSADYALALTIIGHDSIVGTLGRSLLGVLRSGAGKRLCDISYPKEVPETGVPYTERIAEKDCSVGGVEWRAGDRVRLYLDEAACPAGHAESRPLFGRGRHSCLGEDISEWLWRTLTAELSALPFRCTVEGATRRERDYVFVYYSSIAVRFHD